VRLTIKSAAVLKLPHGKSDHIEFDEDVHGFGLRLRAGGSRTWVYQCRIGTKQRRMVLGSATSVPLTLARETAGRLEAKVKLGGDPAMDKEIARGEAFSTFGMSGCIRKSAAPVRRMPCGLPGGLGVEVRS
jgi:Arm DNA-binding domain